MKTDETDLFGFAEWKDSFVKELHSHREIERTFGDKSKSEI